MKSQLPFAALANETVSSGVYGSLLRSKTSDWTERGKVIGQLYAFTSKNASLKIFEFSTAKILYLSKMV